MIEFNIEIFVWIKIFVFDFFDWFWWSLLILFEMFLWWIWIWSVWVGDWLKDVIIELLLECVLFFFFFVLRGWLFFVVVVLELIFMIFDSLFFNCNRLLLIVFMFVLLIWFVEVLMWFESFVLFSNGLEMLLFICCKCCVEWIVLCGKNLVLFLLLEFLWLLKLLLFVFLLDGIKILENLIIMGVLGLFCFFLLVDELLFFFFMFFMGDWKLDVRIDLLILFGFLFLYLWLMLVLKWYCLGFLYKFFEVWFLFLFLFGKFFDLLKC